MNFIFGIARWDAWMPGVRAHGDWMESLSSENLAHESGVSDDNDKCLYLKTRQQRRMKKVCKLAVDCALGALGDNKNIHSVFASRYGEIDRVTKMLYCLGHKELLSPTDFSLSVHNATSGLFSIAAGNQAPSTAIASGANTVISGFIEAISQLFCGKESVLLVVYEDIIPTLYNEYVFNEEKQISAAFLLTRQKHFKLQVSYNTQYSDRTYSTYQQIMQVLKIIFYRSANVLYGNNMICKIEPIPV